MVGQTLGRYEITGLLGEGGMGRVWRAWDTRLEREVALKVTGATGTTRDHEQLLREARLASRISRHPHIATILDVEEIDGQVCISMDLIEGQTLAERLADGPLPLEDILRIGRQAASALEAAHQAGVVHRDISPRNIMLDRAGDAVLLDFGLAVAADGTRRSLATAPVGTASYVAPEVARGHPATERSDIYSLCAVLYEAATGERPFGGERLEAVLYAVLHEQPAPASDHRRELPPGLSALLAAGLSKTVEERPGDAGELGSAIASVAAGAMPALPRPRRSRRPARRGKLALASMASLLGFALLGAAAGWWQRPAPGGELAVRSAAVVPLQLFSPEPDADERLAEGLWATLSGKLTRATPINVLSWETSRRFAGEDRTPTELARVLGVDVLVSGQLSGSRGRMYGTLSLLDGATGRTLWLREIDIPRDRALELQGELALELVAAMQLELTRGQQEFLLQPAGRDAEAFELYLEGARVLQAENRQARQEAQHLFTRALDRDPTLAIAQVGLGACANMAYWYGWEGGPRNLDRAESRFHRALELDPDLMAARHGLITVAWSRGRNEMALQQGRLAAASGRQDVDALFVQGLAYMFGGLPGRGVQVLRKVQQLDPLHRGAAWHLVIALGWANRPEEALVAGSRYIHQFGEDGEMRLHMADAYLLQDRPEMALANFERAEELFGKHPNLTLLLARPLALAEMGRGDEAQRDARRGVEFLDSRLAAFPENEQLHLHRAYLCAFLGDLAGFEESYARARALSGFAYISLAGALEELGRPDEAEAWLLQQMDQGWFSARVFAPMDAGVPGYFLEVPARFRPVLERRHRELLGEYTFGPITLAAP